MLSTDELYDVLERITAKVTLANRLGQLDDLLIKWGFDDFVDKQTVYETERLGKIIVIGGTKIKEKELLGIAKEYGLDKKRFEFCLDYSESKTFEYNKLRYNPKYRLVIFGPTPHSSTGKNKSGSVISEMQTQEGYPKVEVLCSNCEVKITKSNFEAVIKKMLFRQ